MGHGWGTPPARFNKGAGGAEAGIGIRKNGGQGWEQTDRKQELDY